MVEGMEECHQPFAPLGYFHSLFLPLGIEQRAVD
jgi:hypothetical protein